MLGSGLTTAMAAKLAYPDRRAISLTGDGSFGFNGMELDTAVRHGINVVSIMGNDAAWGIDRQIQLEVYGKPVATDLLPTRYDRWPRPWDATASTSPTRTSCQRPSTAPSPPTARRSSTSTSSAPSAPAPRPP